MWSRKEIDNWLTKEAAEDGAAFAVGISVLVCLLLGVAIGLMIISGGF